MATVNKTKLMNELYDALIVSAGVVVIFMVFKRILGEKLTTVSNLRDTANFAVGVTPSTLLVKWVQDKKYLPVDPFKM